jgi:hypothetical protein
LLCVFGYERDYAVIKYTDVGQLLYRNLLNDFENLEYIANNPTIVKQLWNSFNIFSNLKEENIIK